jgi:Rieske Fe-S protein
VGGGAIMKDGDYVVTQPEKGTYKAFSKICTHRQCPVSEVNNDGILCKCHNSVFSISDGSPQSGPAQAPLAQAKAVLSGDKVVVTA